MIIIENVLKFILSIPLVLALFFSLSLLFKLWNAQIDMSHSVKLWMGKQLSLSNWLAIRDPNLIYQDGRPVGFIEVEPTIEEKKIVFPKVRYISPMYENQNLEFRRFVCDKIKTPETLRVEGFESVGWYINLECDIVRK